MFKKLASQTAIYGLPTIIGRLLNYFLVPLYTYNFSPSEYGTVNELYAYVSFLLIVLTYGMETALFNFSRLYTDTADNGTGKQKVFSAILTCVTITSGIFIAVLTVFSQPIANLIRYPLHHEYVIWFAWILGTDAVSSIVFAKLREQNKSITFAVIKTLNVGVNIFFNLFFIVFCKNIFENSSGVFYSFVQKIYSPEIGVGYIFISNLIASIFTLIIQLPAVLKGIFLRRNVRTASARSDGGYPYIPESGINTRGTALRSILWYSLPLLVAGLAGMTNETMDRILLKYLLPSDIALSQVGIYGACYKISIIMTMFIMTFRYAAEPFFFAQAKEKNAKEIYSRVMNYFVIVCMLIFLGTMMNLSWLKYFVGKAYWEGLSVVPVLLLANFCLGVFFNLSVWYKLSGKTQYGAYLTLFGALITLIGNFVFIPHFGYMASAWTTLLCYASIMVLSYLAGNKYYPVNYRLKKNLGYIILSLILYTISGQFEIFSDILNLIAKNFLLMVFILVVLIFERKNLLQSR